MTPRDSAEARWLLADLEVQARRLRAADHVRPWATRPDGRGGGCTDPRNGGSPCGRHNRPKEQGYTVHRDHTGTWHTYRPDGTEIH